MTWRRNTSRIAGPGRPRVEHADPGQHVVGRRRTGTLRAASSVRPPRRGRRRCRPPRPGPGAGRAARRRRVVQQHLVVAAVGAADQQDHVGAGGPQRGDPGRSSRPAATCTTRAPADRPTRCPASAVTSDSYPTTASRSPPPAERADVRLGDAGAAGRRATAASRPSSTSVSDRGRDATAVASSVPGAEVDRRPPW